MPCRLHPHVNIFINIFLIAHFPPVHIPLTLLFILILIILAITQLFRSQAFKALLEKILGGASVVASRRQARRFRPGLDYTLATPGAPWEWKRKAKSGSSRDVGVVGSDSIGAKGGTSESSGSAAQRKIESGEKQDKEEEEEEEEYMVLDAALCFVDDREPYKEAAWRQDEVGGYVTYLGGDDDEDNDNGDSPPLQEKYGLNGAIAEEKGCSGGSTGGGATISAATNGRVQKNDAAVYKADEGGSLVSVSAASNALSLVLRDDAGITSFVKYVSSAAPGSRFDVTGEYLVLGAVGDDDEDSSEVGSRVRGGAMLDPVPEEYSEEEEEEEDDDARSRKKMKAS